MSDKVKRLQEKDDRRPAFTPLASCALSNRSMSHRKGRYWDTPNVAQSKPQLTALTFAGAIGHDGLLRANTYPFHDCPEVFLALENQYLLALQIVLQRKHWGQLECVRWRNFGTNGHPKVELICFGCFATPVANPLLELG